MFLNVGGGSARAMLRVLPSARALHSVGSGAGARTATARAGCSAVTGLPWPPRGGTPTPLLAPARPSAFCPQKRGTERDVLLPRLARLPRAGLGRQGLTGRGSSGVPNPPGTAATGRPVPAPRGALSQVVRSFPRVPR